MVTVYKNFVDIENGIHAIGFINTTDGRLVYSEWIMYETDEWYIIGNLFNTMNGVIIWT